VARGARAALGRGARAAGGGRDGRGAGGARASFGERDRGCAARQELAPSPGQLRAPGGRHGAARGDPHPCLSAPQDPGDQPRGPGGGGRDGVEGAAPPGARDATLGPGSREVRGVAPLRGEGSAWLRPDPGERAGRRRSLQEARRDTPGHRARRRQGQDHEPGPDLRAARPLAPASHRRRPGDDAPAADAARRARLEPRPPPGRRAGPVPASLRLRGRFHPGGRGGGGWCRRCAGPPRQAGGQVFGGGGGPVTRPVPAAGAGAAVRAGEAGRGGRGRGSPAPPRAVLSLACGAGRARAHRRGAGRVAGAVGAGSRQPPRRDGMVRGTGRARRSCG